MRRSSKPTIVKPPALRSGDRVGIVAPASSFKREDFDAGCDFLRGMGYEPVFNPSIFERDLYFAGSTERRAHELHEMFSRDDIKAILCARGGYGSNYLLPSLDVNKMAAHPKVFVGYSDLTSLMTCFYDAAGLVSFHGPMVAKDLAISGGIDTASWQAALGVNGDLEFNYFVDSDAKALVQGSAQGSLYGGCLSMLVASLGTPYEVNTADTILFIEDVATKPYQIDRMLMHLKLAGKLSEVRGIVFGEMLDCAQPGDQRYTLEEVVMRIVGGMNIPVAYGLRSGHVSRSNITLPLGVAARLEVDTSTISLRLTDSPTI
jgi:muramoyltetrapeptide carboxypeptidase